MVIADILFVILLVLAALGVDNILRHTIEWWYRCR